MEKPRLAWAITGTGHNIEHCLDFLMTLEYVDLFISRAAEDVLKLYGINIDILRDVMPVYQEIAASTERLGCFYKGHYHTLVMAPTSSNSVVKCGLGIADSLVTNLYAQAGKSKVQSIIYPTDTEAEIESDTPDGKIMIYPRQIDLEASNKLRTFEYTDVVNSVEDLLIKVKQRLDSVA